MAVLVSWAVAAPGWADGYPAVGEGAALGADPYVEEFQREMSAVKGAMTAMGAAIEAVQIPSGSRSGALAAKAAMAAEFAGMAGLQARAEAARLKIVGRLDSLRNAEGLRLGPAPKTAGFDAAARPSLRSVNSPVGYGGDVGVGFPSAPMSPHAAFSAPSRPAGQSDAPAIGPVAGMGSAGGAAGASVGKTELDPAPAASPAAGSISKNTSDVAAKAAAAREKSRQDAKSAKEKAAADAKQKRQMMLQMAMQGVMMGVQLVAKAAESAKKKKEEGGKKADGAASSAPAGS